MIIRCHECTTAFAVDDSKVEGKKFFFKCPSCSAENLIDNRAGDAMHVEDEAEQHHPHDDTHFEAAEGGAAAQEGSVATASAEAPADDAISDDFFDDVPETETDETPVSDFDDDFMTEERVMDNEDDEVDDFETSSETSSMDGDTDLELPEGLDNLDFSDVDTSQMDSEELDLDIPEIESSEETSVAGEGEEEMLEEFEDPHGDAFMPSHDTAEEGIYSAIIAGKTESDASIDSTGEEEPVEIADELDDGLDFSDDLMDDEIPEAGEGAELEELNESVGEESVPGLEITDDVDETPIELDVEESLDDLDIDDIMDDADTSEASDDESGVDIESELLNTEESIEDELFLDESEPVAEDDLLDEIPVYDHTSAESTDETTEDSFDTIDDEPMTLTPDDTEEIVSEEISADEEDVTIDLDSLDIDIIDEGELKTGEEIDDDELLPDLPVSSPDPEPAVDDDVTLDLDSLDIDLEENDELQTGEVVEEDEFAAPEPAPSALDDDNVTLDLDSLDIDLEENDELQTGEELDEDEKLTLEDAGLTLDELTAEVGDMEVYEESPSVSFDEDDEDEDIHLTLDEIDPTLSVHNLEDELRNEETTGSAGSDIDSLDEIGSYTEEDHLMTDDIDDLPEIEMDDDDEFYPEEERDASFDTSDDIDMEPVIPDSVLNDDDDDIVIEPLQDDYDEELLPDEEDDIPLVKDSTIKGNVTLSVDYALSSSRVGALLRLTGLVLFTQIPSLITFIIYSVLSVILGAINHLVVFATGEGREDFSQIIENTLRLGMSMGVSSIGTVEELPVPAGRPNIDYPLQFSVTYPVRNSRLLALARLSVVGIVILALPHILVLAALSLVVPVFTVAGLISVLFMGQWPALLFDYITLYYRYYARVMAYITGLVDSYPPFTLS